MNLLFIQGGSRLKLCENGNWYTDPNFTVEVWNRYLSLCDHLVILLRKEHKIYSVCEANSRFNPIPVDERIKVVALDDITRPKYNLFLPAVWTRIKNSIEREVAQADKIIIRSASFYTAICQNACIRQGKPYLAEVTGFALEGMKHHSFLGKLSARYFESLMKTIAKDADAAIYVTDEALQKRYPCRKMLGCSDVVLPTLHQQVLDRRLQHIDQQDKRRKLKIGTAAFLDVKWKGQENVIKALAELKKRGQTNIEYELVGMGSGKRLINLALKLGVAKQVRILGPKPHEEIFNWLDQLDIYVQPSYQEGLCRIIIEAMSRACPVICSDAGGNYELIDKNFIFPCGDYMDLVNKLEKITVYLREQAIKNFEHAKRFDKEVLNGQRDSFLREFVNNYTLS